MRALVIVLATTACTVGPDYVRPQVPVNAAWTGDPRLAADAAEQIAWWRGFKDPVLDQLVDLAYKQNLTLQIAGLRILEARAQLGIAYWEQFPVNTQPIATATANVTSSHAPDAGPLADHRFGDYQVGFDALWEPDFWGKYRRGVRAAHADYLATIADYEQALVSLTAEVARVYVVIRGYEVSIAQARDNEQIQSESLDIAKARFNNGATSELDVAQATALLETTRASIPVLEMSLIQARNALSTLLAQPTGHLDALLATSHGIPTAPAIVAVGVPARVLERRPDIRAAELRAMAQCDRIGIAKADLYPSLQLFGVVGTETSSNGGAAANNSSLENLFGPGSLFYRIGGSLLWPILSYPRIRNNVRVQDARFQELLVEYEATVLAATQEVEDAMTGFLKQQDAAAFAGNAMTAAQYAVQLSLVQYREGAVSYERVLDSQRALLDSQNRLTTTQASAATALVALYKALGGAWQLYVGQPAVPDHVRDDMKRRTDWGHYLDKPPTTPSPQK